MATSRYQTTQFSAEHFVESAGAVLFKVSTRQICVLHNPSKNEWLLAKGRRNVGESRQRAALREAREETGYEVRLLPITMATRAPPAVEELDNDSDKPRTYENVCEPFMVTHRLLEEGNLKIIWWYIAAIEEHLAPAMGESRFEARLMTFDDALATLTYACDQDVVRTASDIFNNTFKQGGESLACDVKNPSM